MPSVLVSLAGKPLATYAIDRACMRIGRSGANDIVLDGPTVSSAHAILVLSGDQLAIEDLGSSNGTFVGGTRIERADLEDGSVVSIGDYALKLVANRQAMAYEPTMLVRPGAIARQACLQRLDGAPPGELVELTKVVTSLGKPGEGMVTIIRRGDDFAVRFADGPKAPSLNGVPLVAGAPVRLNPGDVLETDTGRLQFVVLDAHLQSPSPAAAQLHQPQPLPQPAEKAGSFAAPLSWLRRALSRAPAQDGR